MRTLMSALIALLTALALTGCDPWGMTSEQLECHESVDRMADALEQSHEWRLDQKEWCDEQYG